MSHLRYPSLSPGSNQLQLDPVTFNSLLDTAEATGQWQLASSLLGAMQFVRLPNNCIGLSAVAGSCEKAQQPAPGFGWIWVVWIAHFSGDLISSHWTTSASFTSGDKRYQKINKAWVGIAHKWQWHAATDLQDCCMNWRMFSVWRSLGAAGASNWCFGLVARGLRCNNPSVSLISSLHDPEYPDRSTKIQKGERTIKAGTGNCFQLLAISFFSAVTHLKPYPASCVGLKAFPHWLQAVCRTLWKQRNCCGATIWSLLLLLMTSHWSCWAPYWILSIWAVNYTDGKQSAEMIVEWALEDCIGPGWKGAKDYSNLMKLLEMWCLGMCG